MGKRLTRTLLAGLLLCMPLLTHAAGLGRLTVHSGLGQPLRAEIEIVSLERGEADSLTAKLAGTEAFRQANIEFPGVLQNLRFSVEQRPNNRYVVLMSSTGPLNEPFIDVLVELSWTTGRLIREYTFLLDPQEFKGSTPQTQVVPPQTRAAPAPAAPAVAEPPAVTETPRVEPQAAPQSSPAPAAEVASIPEPPRAAIEPAAPSAPASIEPVPAEPAVSVESIASAAEALRAITEARRAEVETQEKMNEPQPGATDGTPATPPPAAPSTRTVTADGYKVVTGDTLSKIATDNMPQGVTLNQMLTALYRANQDAFVERNMNRLRSRRILNIPDRETVAGISPQDANNVVVAHVGEWNTYRAQLASAAGQAPARPETAGQTSGGQITARVTDAPQSGGAPDRLQLAQADPAAKADSAAGRVAKQDDSVARDRALQESHARVTQLEKSLKDIEKLLDLKSQELARLQSQAKGADAATKAPPATSAAPTSAVPPKVEAPKVEAPKIETLRVEAPKVDVPKVEAPRVEAPVVEAPKVETSVARPPVAAAPKQAPAPEPAVETSIVDGAIEFVTDNLLIVGGAAGGLVLIGLLLALRRRRSKKVEDNFGQDSVESSSVFGAADSASADMQSPSSVQAEFSQGGIGAIDTEEVDPVAEADVYMAYGRDAQAEEILKEALQKDQNRHAVRVKLMEIYAARKDLRAFETTAGELYAATGGEGPDWEKAAAIGSQLDPSNTMYQVGAGAGGTGLDNGGYGDAGSANTPEPTARASESYALPAGLDLEATGGPNVPAGLDIALDSPSQFAPRADINLDEPATSKKSSNLEFDLSLGDTATRALQPDREAGGQKKSDFDIEFDLPATPKNFDSNSGATENDKMAEFDMDLELSGTSSPGRSNGMEFDLGSPKTVAPSMDLGGINLDLGDLPAPSSTSSQLDPHWQEVATKLDLTKAYHEMGDRDGAKELLGEVMKEGDGAQQQQARKMMETIT